MALNSGSCSESSGFVSGLLELFPLEGGGGLQNQAAHANWRLRLAEFLDAQTAVIRQAAEEADKIHVTDAEGMQIVTDMNNGQILLDNGNGLLLETDFGSEVIKAIRQTSGNAGWVTGLVETKEYASSLIELLNRSNVDFQSFIPCYSGSAMMKTSQNLVSRLGRSIFSNSHFQDAVEYFTPEGTTRLLKSLDQFTQAVQANQSIFTGLVFEDIGTNLLKPKLNKWAQTDGGIETKFVAAFAGYNYQVFTTVGTLAAMAGDADNDGLKLIKRTGGHLFGLAISAAMGSEQARAELGKMAPGYAEYLLGVELTDQWKQGDYFEAGRTKFNFDLQVVGDVTIAIPLAKGAATVLRVGGQISRRMVAQGLRRAEQAAVSGAFERRLPPPLPGAASSVPPPLLGRLVLPKKCKMPAPVKANRYLGVTYLRHLRGLWAETKFANYLHYMTDEIVILWGDGVGTHGADIITVNSKTGRVSLWDTKWRTNPRNIGPSKTLSKYETLENAKGQARLALEDADYLPLELRQKAVASINSGSFGKYTPGIGGSRSSGVQFTNPTPPP